MYQDSNNKDKIVSKAKKIIAGIATIIILTSYGSKTLDANAQSISDNKPQIIYQIENYSKEDITSLFLQNNKLDFNVNTEVIKSGILEFLKDYYSQEDFNEIVYQRFKGIELIVQDIEDPNIAGYFSLETPNKIYTEEYCDTIYHELIHLLQNFKCKYNILIESTAELFVKEFFNKPLRVYSNEIHILRLLAITYGTEPILMSVFGGENEPLEAMIKSSLNIEEAQELLKLLEGSKDYQRIEELVSKGYKNLYNEDINNAITSYLLLNECNLFNPEDTQKDKYFYEIYPSKEQAKIKKENAINIEELKYYSKELTFEEYVRFIRNNRYVEIYPTEFDEEGWKIEKQDDGTYTLTTNNGQYSYTEPVAVSAEFLKPFAIISENELKKIDESCTYDHSDYIVTYKISPNTNQKTIRIRKEDLESLKRVFDVEVNAEKEIYSRIITLNEYQDRLESDIKGRYEIVPTTNKKIKIINGHILIDNNGEEEILSIDQALIKGYIKIVQYKEKNEIDEFNGWNYDHNEYTVTVKQSQKNLENGKIKHYQKNNN